MITINRIAGALGAEIGGVDLSQNLSDAIIAEIRQALLDHLVIFFRDQDITPGPAYCLCTAVFGTRRISHAEGPG